MFNEVKVYPPPSRVVVYVLLFSVSVGITRKEMKSLFKGVFMLLISGSHAAFYMMCDYGLYWLLEMLRRFFTKNIGAPGQYSYVMYLHVFKYFSNVKLFLNANCYVYLRLTIIIYFTYRH